MTDDDWPKGETTEITYKGGNVVLCPVVRVPSDDWYFVPKRNTCPGRKPHGNRRARERAARRWLRRRCPRLSRQEVLDGGRAAACLKPGVGVWLGCWAQTNVGPVPQLAPEGEQGSS